MAGLVDHSCVVYLDDILIYSATREDYQRHVCEVLTRLRTFGLYANPKKCKFWKKEVEYLGFIVRTDCVAMDPRRITAIEDWPTPRTLKDVQSFLGFANFYRRFIHGYSRIAGPLTALSKGAKNGKKPGPVEWGAGKEQAFRTLKAAFTAAPVLRHFDPALKIRVETDASKFALAGILSQLCGTEWHPIAYYSRKMEPAEENYETHD